VRPRCFHCFCLPCCGGCRTSNYPATRRLTPSCGVNDGLRQPLSLYYRSRLSNPSKDCLTPSKTTIQYLFLALSRLCKHIPVLYRCEQQNLPLESIMQILVAEYLHKCILFLAGWNGSDKYHPSCAHSASRELRLERGREASIHRPQEKVSLS
jgi:hypothetical protein